MNPAREVKTERFSRTEGKTPAFVEGEVQKGVLTTSIVHSFFKHDNRFYRVREGDPFETLQSFAKQGIISVSEMGQELAGTS
jgi:hypothetical protein